MQEVAEALDDAMKSRDDKQGSSWLGRWWARLTVALTVFVLVVKVGAAVMALGEWWPSARTDEDATEATGKRTPEDPAPPRTAELAPMPRLADEPLAVDVRTTKPDGVYRPGEEMVITVTNHEPREVHFTLVGTSVDGEQVTVIKDATLEAGGTFRFPAEGGLVVQPAIGKEQLTLFASEQPIPEGQFKPGKEASCVHIAPGETDGVTEKNVFLETRPAE